MNEERFRFLFRQYADGNISIEEHDELFAMIASGHYKHLIDLQLEEDVQHGFTGQAIVPPHLAQEIVHNIFAAEASALKTLPKAKVFPLKRWLAVAAAILLIACSTFLFTSDFSLHSPISQRLSSQNLEELKNGTLKPLLVQLEDGSNVTLQPNSSLRYPKFFPGDKREVFLEGAGFFSVASNPRKPFYVHYRHIITKVLGTEFTVGTNRLTGNPEISVRSGKVQVYTAKSGEEKGIAAGVILVPNQKVIYIKDKQVLQTTLVDHPQPLSGGHDTEKPQPHSLVFEQERVVKVLQELERRFGVNLVVENEALNNCLFTGDLSGGDLYEQLQIIALTINASYEVNGTVILLKGPGCNEVH